MENDGREVLRKLQPSWLRDGPLCNLATGCYKIAGTVRKNLPLPTGSAKRWV